ncbi:MAG: PSD1 and planctomycete cytochrome C domain-containing protein [Pirellulales bacterium]|nr:PSD1 and planctomycete cytochrome C domain-containing protein [Pirellulales bacterium]
MLRHLLVLVGMVVPLLIQGERLWAAENVTSAASSLPADAISFDVQIRPILKAHCWHCHGEEEERQGTLDTRLVRLLLSGGDSGPAIVPGRHDESLLYQRIAAGEMPPGEKKLSPADVQLIARWIDQGALPSSAEPAALAPGSLFSDAERLHWSFQPIRRPPLPPVTRPDLVATPIDAFLLAELEKQGLSFGPLADRATLMRRLHFDLTGLPPTPAEIEAFVADPAPDAYDQLVERLLASPAYGERWGRHWLDVAGYADSDGYSEKDAERKWAYRYRDYVIRALNNDKPWNEFLVEQLAGDELLAPPYANLSPQQADCLIATGLLRMGPDGTSDSDVDQPTARNEVLADTIKIVSTALLGLSVGCAQCHDHRYDPIRQADYYRLRAIFEPAYDCQKWLTPAARLVSLWPDDVRELAAAVEAGLANLNKQRTAELDALVAETFARELAKLPAEIQPAARAARDTPTDQRTDDQQQLIKQYPFLNVDRGSVYLYLPDRLNGFTNKWDQLLAAASARRPADDLVQCLTEPTSPPPVTRLFYRGDFNQPRQELAPGELSILPANDCTIAVDDPTLPTTGRRLAYARHLTNGRHPLVARVLVNRFWMQHFGRGLVATVADFGMLGEAPSHPALLDWLADDFMRAGWRLKRWHRQVVLSTAYRQSSQRREELDAVDPDNLLLGRMHVRRLEAEVIRDALLAASGQLSNRMFGPSVSVMPDEVGQIVVGVDTRDSAGRPSGRFVSLGEDEFRRSIYVCVRRTMPLGMLESFDAPLMTPNCSKRAQSTVAPQSLLMMNSDFVVQSALTMAERVAAEVGADPAAQVRRAWLLAFAQQPSSAQQAAGTSFLQEQAKLLADQPQPGRVALAHFCQALVSSNGFLYVD